MLIDVVLNRNILTTNHKHIAFCTNLEGWGQGYHISDQIQSKYWPDLFREGRRTGDAISYTAENYTFHAMFTHSHSFANHNLNLATDIKNGLDSLLVAKGRIIAMQMYMDSGDGNVWKILRAVVRSKHKIVLYIN